MTGHTLNTGQTLPLVGFGTWEIASDSDAKAAVLSALEAGYRLIDTARIYGNERGVGEAIRQSGLRRQDIFVTTKLWNDDQGYDRARRACQQSLEKLGLDYLDLYLIHWPATSRRHDSWQAFEKLRDEGLIKAAGVSNYTIDHLEDLADRSPLVPAVNQVEFHPFIYEEQADLLDYCEEHDILIEAYSPLSRISRSPRTAAIKHIADRYRKTPQQVVLRWCIQHDTLPLPRSANPAHIKSNLEVTDFELDDEAMEVLNSVSDGQRVTWDPAGMG
ncbi:MAG TPA: aldo/keto reductase [Candidatus Saccharimonadales bacterium]|nr:aldo/keto reductase [Candidatus Saccharimonadales bacterium]